jgi:hypothetical protein
MKYTNISDDDKLDYIKKYKELSKQEFSNTKVMKKLASEYKISLRSSYNWLNKISKEFNIDVLQSGNSSLESAFITKHKSTLYDKDGNVKLQWLKESLDYEIFYKNLQKAALELAQGVEPLDEIIRPDITDDELVTFYPLPDLHWGLLVAKDESNHEYNYDLKIARRWILSSMKYLVHSAPKSKVAVIADLGDFLHASDNNNRTKSGHVLDTDGRHYKTVKISFEATRLLIEEALTKHEEVVFYSIPGNHSDLSGIHLKAFLSAWFRNNPRVTIVEAHKAQQYYVNGKVILGFSHGHELRPEKASEVLVYDNHQHFSNSVYRYYHFGHFHSNKIFETPLCKIEIHKNIIPRDAWAESQGFRGHIGEAKAISYHKEYGEIARSIFNIRMIED